MTDYKQLCAELVDAIDSGIPTDRMHLSPLMLRARAALAEPEPSINRPDRLRVGDVWEFWTELHVNGKQKTVDKLLQWEVKGWNNWEYAWELQSLDGEHRTYLMEFAPSYEEMRFIRSNESKAQ